MICTADHTSLNIKVDTSVILKGDPFNNGVQIPVRLPVILGGGNEMSSHNWFELYIDGYTTPKRLADLVLRLVNGHVLFTDNHSNWDIESRFGSFSVEENDNIRDSRSSDFDEFLFYPLLITGEQFPLAPEESYVDEVTRIVSAIRVTDLRFAMIADFWKQEDE